MIITKTPYRLSLFGGGTDYPAWFSTNPSRCVSAAMAHYCYIHVKPLSPFFDYSIRVTYSKIESVDSVDEIEHPSIRACLKHLNLKNNISISHDGDLPARSGIGSSSSFTVGLLNALYALKKQHIRPYELAMQAIYVEQGMLGENVGVQDQIMAAHGGIQIIKMGPGNNYSWSTEPLRLSNDYRNELESHILLGFSGISRIAEIQAKKKVDNIKAGINHKLLEETAKLAEEAIDSLAKETDMSIIGKLLDDGWRIKRELAEGVTEAWIDDIYNASLKAGAFGGKLMGAGGGGFFMFIVPPEKQKQFKEKMEAIKVWVPFKFDMHGSQFVLNNS